MRTYTLLFSIAAHTIALAAIVVATLTATDILPAPRRAVDWIEVMPPVPPPAPPVRRMRTETPAAPIPLEAPTGILSEPAEDVPDIDVPVSTGIIATDTIGVPPIAVVEPPPEVKPTGPVRVGGSIEPPRKVVSAPPVYPAIARAAGVQGIVVLEAVIAEDGTVREVRVLRSQPLLDAAAVEAVRKWRFTPTLLNGQPVPVVMTVTVGFSLR
jgi:periplasmic protein TonB